MHKINISKCEQLTDNELVVLIHQNQDYLGEVYKRCKSYSIQFLRKMTNSTLNEYELEDVFHDGILVLYEKIIGGNFVLTSSLQVYLNSVCRNQLLTKIRKNKLNFQYQENNDDENEDNPIGFKTSVTDTLDDIEEADAFRFSALERALISMKQAGGHCYELLTLFWYHKKSMKELTAHFAYTNSDNTKQQKARCQKRLEKMAFYELKQS